MFKNPFSFKGRIRRTEYGLSLIFYYLSFALFGFLSAAFEDIQVLKLLPFVLIFASIWFMIAQGVKRCHDQGYSGWYVIMPFFIFWMLFADSQYGENWYGKNPKGIGNPEESGFMNTDTKI